MSNDINILLTSVGRRGYLVSYFKEALAGMGKVHATNSTACNPAFVLADSYSVSPIIYSDEYIPFLLEYCKNNKISVIIPLFDADLPVLASNKEVFAEHGIFLLVSDIDVIEICNDKWKTVGFLNDNNIRHPKTFISLDSAIDAISLGELNFPVIVKPRRGMGSIGIFEADNIDELRVFYAKAKNAVLKSYIRYEAEQDDFHVLIQHKLIGDEYHLDVINDLNGNYQNTIVKRKIAMRAGETDCAQIIENEIICDIGRKLSTLLKHKGNLDADVMQNGNEFCVLEMNARFGGGYPFSHAGGVNLPKAIINWLRNEPVNKNELLCATTGIIAHKDIKITDISNQIK
jgi:carbamoyl-phosphate synthase large subunit